MSEIKKRLNINKITVKNLFLLVLVMIVMAAIGIIAKTMRANGSSIAKVDTACACWGAPPGGCTSCDTCETCGEGEGGEGGTCECTS